jgi:tetratricopeptide (TPR) repeat protein
VADVNEAQLQSKTGKLDEALRLYQEALRLDDSTADSGASAQDWYAYGRFLDNAGFPPRLAFACMVKSEALIQSLPNPAVPASLTAAREHIEKRLGATADAVRRDPEPALREALTLRR